MLHPKYRPDIDGLRALAVLSVIIFHFFPYQLPGGFVGVDIFFVISGYLITGIIISNLEKDLFSFRDFYVRRIRRIFPGMLLILVVCLAAGWYLLLPDEYALLGKHAAAAGVFAANFAFWQEAGYFDTISIKKPLLHLWSLGIEEQFYILWPMLVRALSRHGRRFLGLAIILASVSFAINLIMLYRWPAGDFYSPFSRLWELGAGSILACFHRQYPALQNRYPQAASILGLCLIGLSLAFISELSPFPGGWALLPVAGAVCIIAAGPAAWPNRFLLANKPAVFIGRISYPLYLWHWPLLSFYIIVHIGAPDRNVRLLLILSAFLLAWLTYRFVEPLFRFKSDKQSLLILISMSVITVLVGLSAWFNIFHPRNSDPRLNAVMAAIADFDYPPPDFVSRMIDGVKVLQKGSSTKKTLFVGDFHMEQYAARIDADLDTLVNPNTAILLTHPSCPPVKTPMYREGCGEMQAGFRKLSARNDIDTVVLAGSWESYLYEEPGQTNFASSMEKMLRSLARQKRVFLILDNPQGPMYDPHNSVIGSSRFGNLKFRRTGTLVPRDPKERNANEQMAKTARRVGVAVLDPVPLLCQSELCATEMKDGAPIYKDTSHLRSVFVRKFASFLDQTIRPIR